jgi:hypothetical protein
MDIKGKQVSIVIIEHGIALRQQVKSILKSLDEQFAVEMETKNNFFELRNYHDSMKEIHLEQPVKHGAYRQFIKRDKRKNFKVRK